MGGVIPLFYLYMSIKRRQYTEFVTEKLELYYSFDTFESEKMNSLGDEINGFLKAGIILGVITKEEFLSIADEAHKKIFGKSLEHSSIDRKLGEKVRKRDWSRFDEPSFIRKKKS